MEDRFILEGIRRQDQQFLRELFDKYSRYAAAVVRKIGERSLGDQDVEEIVSDVFFKIWKQAENIRLEGDTLKAYIGVTARNLTLNELRKKKGGLADLTGDEILASPSAEELYLLTEDMQVLEVLINELKDVDRVIFIRRYFYLEKVKDIALYLGLSEKAVSARIMRAKQLMAETCRQRGVL